MKTFWIVWNGKGCPSKRHESEGDANREAQRLAVNSTEKFFVLEMKGYWERPLPEHHISNGNTDNA